MHIASRTFMDTIDDLPEMSREQKHAAIPLLLAVSLAYNAPLPTAQVESPRRHYMELVGPGVEARIAKFNEYVVIDYDQTSRLAYQIWLLRYRLVHEPGSVSVICFFNALCQGEVAEIPEQHLEIFRAIPGDKIKLVQYLIEKEFIDG